MIKLPRKIFLTAMKKEWKVSYISTPGKLIIIELPHHEIVLYGKKYSKRAALQLIARWVKLKAQMYLSDLTGKLNRKVKVKYKKINVRLHTAQWGSYSTSKTISLNYHLMFLPPALVRHIIFHELCHMLHLSHSSEFWNAVRKYDKNCDKNRKHLIDADKYIPAWAVY